MRDGAAGMPSEAGRWLVLVYKMAPEPARQRIAVWRRLKALGAVYLQQGVCALPETPAHRRDLAELAGRIRAADGEAALLSSVLEDDETTASVRARYDAARDHEYGEIMTAARRLLRHVELADPAEHDVNAAELERLKRWHARVVVRDFFGAPLQQPTAELLQATEAALRGGRVAAQTERE
jgi:hypothetical protein